MISYTLFSSERAFLDQREPIKVTDEVIEVKLNRYDGKAKAEIWRDGGSVIYIDVTDGVLHIPRRIFGEKSGVVNLAISAYGELPRYKRWLCERLGYMYLGDGTYILYPAVGDRDTLLAELYSEVERLKTAMLTLEKEQKQIKETVDLALVGFPTE